MIKANEVMLIDSSGEKQGIVTINDALEAATKASLDLVRYHHQTPNLLFVNF